MRRILAALALVFGGRAEAVEEPPFKLLARWGDCELREYPALVVAETRYEGARRGGESAAFRSLAGFIFGANAASEKIAMTAPVLETPAGGGWTMRFTMPRDKTLEALPAPKDAKVETKLAPPQRFAAIRFSGWATDADLADKGAQLQACLKAQGLTPDGPPALAQYDAPWVLGPWRRNEALLAVK